MHSKTITAAALSLATLELLGFGFPSVAILAAVIVAVVMVGVPHGAADHITGRRLLEPIVGMSWAPLFFSAYLTVGILVLIGWHFLPVFTTLTFFVVAAWHFGTEERDENPLRPLSTLRAIACGGMVIWIPCTMQGARVEFLLTLISDSISSQQSSLVVNSIAACSPLLVSLVLLDCWFEISGSRQSTGFELRQLLGSRTLRYSSFALLFCVADPLLSFGLYFCGWHSICGFKELRDQFDCSLPSLIKRLAPLTLLTVLFVSIGALTWSSGLSISDRSIRWLFLGLSAIAVPHVMLEIVAESYLARPMSSLRSVSGVPS